MDYYLLSNSPLFKGISPEEIKLVLDNTEHRVKKFNTGSMICQTGEPVNSLIVVIKGTVKGEMTDYAGHIIKIEDISAPEALAVAFLFGNRNKFPVNVIAVSDVELLLIGKRDFLKLLMKNGELLINFLDMISSRSQFLSEKIKFLNFKTIKDKLANFILRKAGKDGTPITLGMTQNDLADFFGVTRPSVARAIGELEEDGYIAAKGKLITILNKKGLLDLASD
jgi:CRP/FNR family transcriptional regulator, dissimilatory nitrate respiration regulator